MLPEDELDAILASGGIPGVGCRRVLCRCVTQSTLYGLSLPSAYPSPIPLWSSSSKGSRFVAKGAHDALYLAQDPNTAYMEVDRAYKKVEELEPSLVPQPAPPVILFNCRVELERVLDLTNTDVLKVLKTSEAELKVTWRLNQSRGKPIPTQILGGIVYRSGRFQAIRYHSARDPQGKCLVIFPDLVIAPSFVEVFDPFGGLVGRIPPK